MLVRISQRVSTIRTVRIRLSNLSMAQYNDRRGLDFLNQYNLRNESNRIVFVSQLNKYVWPYGTYSTAAQLVIVLLITDFLRLVLDIYQGKCSA